MAEQHPRQGGFSDARISDDKDVMFLVQKRQRTVETWVHYYAAQLSLYRTYGGLSKIEDACV
jgi:hypothetical protein